MKRLWINSVCLFIGLVLGVALFYSSFYPMQERTGAVSSPSYFKKIGDYVFPVVSTWKVGSSTIDSVWKTATSTTFCLTGDNCITTWTAGVDFLIDIGDVATTTSPTAYGKLLYYTGSAWQDIATSSLGISAEMVYPDAGIALSTGSAWGASITNNSANWNTAYGWGNHAGLYDVLGQATGTLTIHTNTYNHANYDTAYGWGNHASAGYFPLTSWYATTTDALDQGDTNKYLGALSVTATGLDWSSPTLSLNADYIIPKSASTTNWNTFYDTPSNRITDGAGLTWSTNTLNCDTASGSVAGCLSAANWTSFNNKWDLASTTIGVPYGGTGAITLTDHGVLVGSAAGAITPLSVGTDGQLLIGSSGADPVFATLNCADGLACTIGAGTLEIDFDGGNTPAGSLGGTWALPTVDSDETWTLHNSYPTACADGVVTGIGDTLTCTATSTWAGGGWDALSDISLNAGYMIVGNPSNVASATSSLFISQAMQIGMGTTSLNYGGAGGAPLMVQINYQQMSDGFGVAIGERDPYSYVSGEGNLYVAGSIEANNVFADCFYVNDDSMEESICSPFVDAMTFNTNSNTRMTIGSSGNVGIGTSTYYSKLSIWGSGITTGQTFELVNNASTSLMKVLDNGTITMGSSTNATTTISGNFDIAGTAVRILGEYFTNFTTYIRSLFTGGDHITITAGNINVDVELSTKAFQFNIATTTMATTTSHSQFQVPVAFTITRVSGFCMTTGTTTVTLDERNATTPKTAGTDIFNTGFAIGDYNATTTFANASIAADAWVNLDIDGYFSGAPNNCRINVKGTVDD